MAENRKDAMAGFRVDLQQLEDIKAIAYWDRKTVKEVAGEALDAYIKAYKKKNGEIKTPPKK